MVYDYDHLPYSTAILECSYLLLILRQGHIPNVSLHPSRIGDPKRSWSISHQVLLAAGALGVYVWSRRPEPKLKQDWSD